MEKVVVINLNGNSYQLDESAYDAVRAYLKSAESALADNPDRAEIIADLEQAIADKAGAHLGPGKTVISASDMSAILQEMGPVDGGEGLGDAKPADPAPAPGADEKRQRRLYRLPGGAMIAGVASGLGAYLEVDAAIIRVVFIVLAILSSGLAILGYIAAVFVIPSAHTPEQWAEAHGAPFNAQDIIEQAKREYQDFANTTGPIWSRRARRAIRKARRAARRAARYGGEGRYYTAASNGRSAAFAPVGALTSAIAGLIALVFGLAGAALSIALVFAIVSLLATGAVLSIVPPAHVPVWAAALILIFAFSLIVSPINGVRRAARARMFGRPYYGHGFDGLVWLGLIALGAWLTYVYAPASHPWFSAVNTWLQHAWASVLAQLPR